MRVYSTDAIQGARGDLAQTKIADKREWGTDGLGYGGRRQPQVVRGALWGAQAGLRPPSGQGKEASDSDYLEPLCPERFASCSLTKCSMRIFSFSSADM